MIVLGISGFYHDSAAALVRDGGIVAAAQEERFTRIKHDAGFPAGAVAYCLDAAGLTLDQVDYASFYDKPLLTFDRLLETYLAFAPRGLPSFVKAIPTWVKEKILQKNAAPRGHQRAWARTPGRRPNAVRISSPFACLECVLPVAVRAGRYFGDGWRGGVGNDQHRRRCGEKVELLDEIRFPHSIGMLYSPLPIISGLRSMKASTR